MRLFARLGRSARISLNSGASGAHVFTALTFDAANAAGGSGPFFGLWLDYAELISEVFAQIPPFFQTLNAMRIRSRVRNASG